jgi:1,4-alpha-glucan branching enzyme
MPEESSVLSPQSSEVGDLAIVLHSHMPYVEGFGTYPFGEEWLFDAVCRSYIPVLEVAEHLTMTITPVLADQLEADGVGERMRRFIEAHRMGGAELDAERAEPGEVPAARAWAKRYRLVLDRLDDLDGNVVKGFAEAERDGRIALMASAATHAVLPMVATRAGRRLQIDAGIRSHRRRFGSAAGFWLPECAYEPGLERLLAERGVEYFCLVRSPSQAGGRLAPIATPSGPVAFGVDWPTVESVWSWSGYPADPLYAEHHSRSDQGTQLWAIGKRPYDPEAAAARAREHATEFLAAVGEQLAAYASERGERGLVVFASDTELFGDWWSEGPTFLAEVIRAAPELGVRLLSLPEALEAHQPDAQPLEASTWGAGKDLSTWDAPEVADLAWGARRLELRLLRVLGERRLDQAAAKRAARELLACQSSDWAFLDKNAQAGDYPFRRAVSHAESMLEALDSVEPEPRMRNLAPDLSIAPLLEP